MSHPSARPGVINGAKPRREKHHLSPCLASVCPWHTHTKDPGRDGGREGDRHARDRHTERGTEGRGSSPVWVTRVSEEETKRRGTGTGGRRRGRSIVYCTLVDGLCVQRVGDALNHASRETGSRAHGGGRRIIARPRWGGKKIGLKSWKMISC